MSPFTTSTHIIAKCQLRAPASQPPNVSQRRNRLAFPRIAAEQLALPRERRVGVEDLQTGADHDDDGDDVHPVGDADDPVVALFCQAFSRDSRVVMDVLLPVSYKGL